MVTAVVTSRVTHNELYSFVILAILQAKKVVLNANCTINND